MKDTKDTQIASLRGKLGALTVRYEEDRKFYAKESSGQRDLITLRNSLSWLLLDALAVLGRYDDSVTRLACAGLRAKMDELLPGFIDKVQADRDRRDEGNAQADARERAERAAKLPKENS